MRRSSVLLRGAKGYGWYTKFMREGQQGFKLNPPPTPFNWESTPDAIARPKAVFEMMIDTQTIGKITIELASDIVPKTVDNFKRFCLGEASKFPGKSYKGSKIHYVNKGVQLMGGDVVSSDGTFNHSSYDSTYFEDENFIIPHSQRGFIR